MSAKSVKNVKYVKNVAGQNIGFIFYGADTPMAVPNRYAVEHVNPEGVRN
jgi:hypothetical protein